MHQHDLLMGTGTDEALLERKSLVDTQPHHGIDCHTNRRLIRAVPRTFDNVASWHRRSIFPV